MIYSALTMYMSLNQLLCLHPAAQVKLKLELRDIIETLVYVDLDLNLDQCPGMKMEIIICNVMGTSASLCMLL